MKVVVIVPTYNERDNVLKLVPALHAEFAALRHEFHILIVDDSSPDGTAEAVRGMARYSPNLHLLTGKKVGLGAAYIRGMKYALSAMHADVIFEMDADFSHKPSDISRLLAAIESGSDFVIGSRYVPGGSIPQEWSWHRKANSLFGNLVARHIAGIRRIKDCTAGFRAIRASILSRIDFSSLRVQGYAFQVALLHAAVSQGAIVKEIPVDFVDRTEGDSKLGISDIIEFIVNAWWIRFSSSKTFIKFALVGISGVAVNLAVFSILTAYGMNKFLASPIAIEASIVTNFLLNNYWTFRWRKTRDRTRVKGFKFNLVSLASLVVSYGTFVIMSFVLPTLPPQVHQAIGIAPAMLINYFLNSNWTFRSVGQRSGDRK